ncbi:TPA: hypothetical protein HA246_04585 [Candidatus Woesearchaeota archaeon]|nr:hypothetical protein [Candidatus Woesearchaeota archaeon]
MAIEKLTVEPGKRDRKKLNWIKARQLFIEQHGIEPRTAREVCLERVLLAEEENCNEGKGNNQWHADSLHEKLIDSISAIARRYVHGRLHYKIINSLSWNDYLSRYSPKTSTVHLTEYEYAKLPGTEFVVVQVENTKYAVLKRDHIAGQRYSKSRLERVDSDTGFSLGDKLEIELAEDEIMRNKSWLAIFGYDFSKAAADESNFQAKNELQRFVNHAIIKRKEHLYTQLDLATRILDDPKIMSFGPRYHKGINDARNLIELMPICLWGRELGYEAFARAFYFPGNFVAIVKKDK